MIDMLKGKSSALIIRNSGEIKAPCDLRDCGGEQISPRNPNGGQSFSCLTHSTSLEVQMFKFPFGINLISLN